MLCSPSTHLIASDMLLFPDPLSWCPPSRFASHRTVYMSHAVLFRTKSKTPYRKHLLHRGTASRRCVATRPPQQPKHGTICPHARTLSTFGSCRDVPFFAAPCRFPQNRHLSSHIIHELSSHFNPLILRIVSQPAECAAAGSCTTPCRLHALIHLVPAPSRLHTRTHRWRKGRSARRALHHRQ